MDQATHNKIVSFIWGIADDVLRDLFRRGKYPDVILPMFVIRRMDAVLEPTKQAVLDTKKMLDDARITEQRAALYDAAGQAFYNTSRFTLRDLKSCGSQQQLLADFDDYLNGYSPNVQDILENFKFRNQLSTLSKADALGTLVNKFLDPEIDLSPVGIDNHAMGTVFEELVRKYNEENNEEAGEHWTPRDAVRLMANLVFLPIEAALKSGTYLHACLKWVMRDYLTNASLRERFGVEEKNKAAVSRYIREAVEAGMIKPYDEDAARKMMKYVPHWA